MKKIFYKLKRSKRAKRMRLAVYCDGSVVVTGPFGIEQSLIEKFITEKKQWVWDKIKFFKNIDSKVIRTFSHNDYLENKDKTKHCEQCNVDVCHSHWGRHLNTKKHKKNSTINILPNIGTE